MSVICLEFLSCIPHFQLHVLSLQNPYTCPKGSPLVVVKAIHSETRKSQFCSLKLARNYFLIFKNHNGRCTKQDWKWQSAGVVTEAQAGGVKARGWAPASCAGRCPPVHCPQDRRSERWAWSPSEGFSLPSRVQISRWLRRKENTTY